MNVDKEMLLKQCNEYAELFHGKSDETPTMRKTQKDLKYKSMKQHQQDKLEVAGPYKTLTVLDFCEIDKVN